MAHELSIIEDLAEFAYLVSEGAAWHNLGQSVEANQPLDVWEQACNISTWTIDRRKALSMDKTGTLHRIPNTITLNRSDNGAHLATVSEGFNVHQPTEVSKWMFDAVAQLGFEISTMGVLFDGKKFWCQANIKQSVNIGGIDRVDGKLLIVVSNTGKEATVAHYTTCRVVCNNTLRAATSTGSETARLNHMSAFNAADFSEKLGLFDLAEWARAAENMARATVTETQAYDFLGRVFDIYEEKEDDNLDVIERQEERLSLAYDSRAVMSCFNLFNGQGQGAELVTAKNTVWGLVNSVTQYVDHDRRAQSFDTRFDSAQFGAWANVKDNAWAEGVMMV